MFEAYPAIRTRSQSTRKIPYPKQTPRNELDKVPSDQNSQNDRSMNPPTKEKEFRNDVAIVKDVLMEENVNERKIPVKVAVPDKKAKKKPVVNRKHRLAAQPPIAALSSSYSIVDDLQNDQSTMQSQNNNVMIMNGQVKNVKTERKDPLKLVIPAKNIKGEVIEEQEHEPILPSLNTTLLLPCSIDDDLWNQEAEIENALIKETIIKAEIEQINLADRDSEGKLTDLHCGTSVRHARISSIINSDKNKEVKDKSEKECVKETNEKPYCYNDLIAVQVGKT